MRFIGLGGLIVNAGAALTTIKGCAPIVEETVSLKLGYQYTIRWSRKI